MKRKKTVIVAAVLLFCGAFYFRDMGSKEEGLIIPQQEEIARNGYPTNENGETYGPLVAEMDEPDLSLAEGTDGITGYIKNAEWPIAESIEEALAMNGKQVKMNLYLQDGETVIGEFLTGN